MRSAWPRNELLGGFPHALADLSAPRCAFFGGAAGHLGSVFERQPDGPIALRLRTDELARFSPQAQRWLPSLQQIIQRHAITFPLPPGAGYAVNNRWRLHGRRAFTGHRAMRRVLVTPHRGRPTPAGFEPPGETR
jgi:hypothetical protein